MATEPQVGDYLGHYRIEQKLGEGGMGAVYKGHEAALDRLVALKILSSKLAADAEFADRFLREARAVAKLNHPNIIQVYYVAQQDGLLFFAMEFVDGWTLDAVQKQYNQCRERDALAWIRQAAQGLAHAHAHGVIHRDIKPANLMVNREGIVKIADFGLAKVVGGQTSALTLTAAQTIMGTPQYMSPEQAQGRPLDHRSDIYSLGATLYHLLAGRPPFVGDTAMGIMMQHIQTPLTPIVRFNPHVSTGLSRILFKMMAKNPSARYQTYNQLIHDLTALLEAPVPSQSIAQPAAQPVIIKPDRTPLIVTTAVLALFAAIGSIVWFENRPAPPPKIPQPTVGSSQPSAVSGQLKTQSARPVDDAWIKYVQAMSRDEQGKAVAAKLKEMNPQFSGIVRTEQGRFRVEGKAISNIAPLRALTKWPQMAITDTSVSDLSPLMGLPLTELKIAGNPIRDLSPLRGMPLVTLMGSGPYDMNQIRGLKLEILMWDNNTEWTDLSVLSGMPIHILRCSGSGIRDFSRLKDFGLKELMFDFQPDRDVAVLRSIRTLEKINYLPAAEFWKRYDAGEFGKPQAAAAVAQGGIDDPARWARAINLLPLIDPQKDAVAGQWKLENGELVCSAFPESRVAMPFKPPQEYDVRMEFTRKEAGDAMSQILSRGDRRFAWTIFTAQKSCLFENIVGKDGYIGNPSTVRPAGCWDVNRKYVSIVQVRENGLRAFIDGKPICEWKTDYSDMRENGNFALRDGDRLGLRSAWGRMTFNGVELLEITGRGSFTRPDDPAAKEAEKKRAVAPLR